MMFKGNHQCQTLTRQLSKTDETPTPSTSAPEYTDNAPRKTLTRQLSKTSAPPSSPSNGASSRQRRERHDPSATAAVRNAAKRRPEAVPKPVALKAIVETTPNSDQMRVRVPERLLRPAWKDVNEEALAACGPEMANVPIKFIRDNLKEIGPQMLAAARGQSLPAREVPTSIKVEEEDDSLPFAPTHMLAVYSPRDWAIGGRRAVRYVPIHDVVLAAHCTNLPALPPRNPSPTSIAVTSLRLPETTTFGVVLDYLYTKNVTTVLGALLPRSAVGVPAKAIPATIAKACSTAELTQRLFRTHALWTNVCALGVHDEALWNIIDSAWQVLLLGLRISSEAGGPVNVAPLKT